MELRVWDLYLRISKIFLIRQVRVPQQGNGGKAGKGHLDQASKGLEYP